MGSGNYDQDLDDDHRKTRPPIPSGPSGGAVGGAVADHRTVGGKIRARLAPGGTRRQPGRRLIVTGRDARARPGHMAASTAAGAMGNPIARSTISNSDDDIGIASIRSGGRSDRRRDRPADLLGRRGAPHVPRPRTLLADVFDRAEDRVMGLLVARGLRAGAGRGTRASSPRTRSGRSDWRCPGRRYRGRCRGQVRTATGTGASG